MWRNLIQAKFDDIARGAVMKFLETTIENLGAEVKDHLEEMGLASANIDGTIARWKAELLKNGLSDAKANSVVEVAIAFVEKYLMILTTKALHVEINRTAKGRSETRMDDGEVFVTSEASIQLIICNEICLASSAVGSPEGNRQLKVSIVRQEYGGKRNSKLCKSQSMNGQAQQNQAQ